MSRLISGRLAGKERRKRSTRTSRFSPTRRFVAHEVGKLQSAARKTNQTTETSKPRHRTCRALLIDPFNEHHRKKSPLKPTTIIRSVTTVTYAISPASIPPLMTHPRQRGTSHIRYGEMKGRSSTRLHHLTPPPRLPSGTVTDPDVAPRAPHPQATYLPRG